MENWKQHYLTEISKKDQEIGGLKKEIAENNTLIEISKKKIGEKNLLIATMVDRQNKLNKIIREQYDSAFDADIVNDKLKFGGIKYKDGLIII
jgi:hypothetical protein